MLKYSINDIRIKVERLPLAKPYVLSFATLEYFDSIRVKITLENGDSRIAEVVPLTGYNEESAASILNFLEGEVNALRGSILEEARSFLEKQIKHHQFAVSPLLTAIDLFQIEEQISIDNNLPLVNAFSVENIQEVDNFLATTTAINPALKIKLSGDVETDSNAMDFLSGLKSSFNPKLRLDANQAYNSESAANFFSILKKHPVSNSLEYVEQPMTASDLHGNAGLTKKFGIPVMLDESVVTIADLHEAANLGVKFVKLKLFKQGGIKECCELIELATEKHINIILGNGVAGPISNAVEHYIHRKYEGIIFGASEANGFKKILCDQ